MSAVLRWRCDICRSEAEVVQEVPRGTLGAAFYRPQLPQGWGRPLGENVDLCSQACRVAHCQRVLAREQRKLATDVN